MSVARRRRSAVVKVLRGVDVATHRGALIVRAGAVVALVAGALIGVASPAHADDKVGVSVGPSTFDLKPGDNRDFGVDVENKTAMPHNTNIVVNTPDQLAGDL